MYFLIFKVILPPRLPNGYNFHFECGEYLYEGQVRPTVRCPGKNR